MAKTWFRIHAEGPSSIVESDKVHELPDRLFRWMVLLWACSCRTDGWLPPFKKIAFRLRKQEKAVSDTVSELVSKRFIDETENGYRIHDWDEHQFRSDVSTDRVHKFRERQRNVSESVSSDDGNVTETPRARGRAGGRSVSVSVSASDSVSEENTETAITVTASNGNGYCEKRWKDECFERFWAIVWAKIGRGAALRQWNQKIRTQAQAEEVIRSAQEQGPLILKAAQVERRGVLHPATWISQGRFDDDVAHIEANLFNEITPPRDTRIGFIAGAVERMKERDGF